MLRARRDLAPLKGSDHHGRLHVLPGRAESAAEARRLLVSGLGARHPYLYNAQLVVTELVANAVRHSRSGLWGGEVGLYIEASRGGAARIEVIDNGPLLHRPSRPVVKRPRDGGEGGRGLALVGAFADVWGTLRNPNGYTTVWARWNAGGRAA
ncbi:ATP-binding protein [Nocardiopsis mangrovi]|uniref:ATP-binding protein n=1 Tax=Nocardiopsis mangrovi TaxID=1179818 RepID=A0ABV9DRT6_9ACTN